MFTTGTPFRSETPEIWPIVTPETVTAWPWPGRTPDTAATGALRTK